ncbi:hypothetical protein MKW92_023153 [Papaver armeniacum]|nr:hypothetical protein MKW92_023153 [Papaver armeniacum]
MLSSTSVVLCSVIAFAIISLTHYVHKWRNPTCKGQLPPGSMGFPIIGETIQLLVPSKSIDMPYFIRKRIARYGPIFRTSLVGQRVVISSDPEFNYFIFQQEGKMVEFWYMDTFEAVHGDANSRAINIAHIHKYIRNLTLSYFGTEVLKEKLISKVEILANQYLQDWSTKSSIEVKDSIAMMMVDYVCKELFNYTPSADSKDIAKVATSFLKGIMCIPLNVPGTAFHKFLRDQKAFLKLMNQVLNKRRASPKNRYGDLLDKIIDDMEKEDFMTEEFATLIMFGGVVATTEGISASLTLAMISLTQHARVLQELQEEHCAILKTRENTDSLLTWKEYKSMTFTNQVINETLRMSGVAPGLLRRVMKDIHINGYTIPKGWTVMVVPSAVQMNPDMFKDPLIFNPYRWNDPAYPIPPKSFIPFGGGSRNCSGAEFSRAVMSVFLHVLVTKFSWKKIKGGDLARNPCMSFGDGFHVKITANESDVKAHIHAQ